MSPIPSAEPACPVDKCSPLFPEAVLDAAPGLAESETDGVTTATEVIVVSVAS